MSSFLKSHYNLKSPHHAFLIEGSTEEILPEIKIFVKEIGFTTEGNPDFSVMAFDTFKIDDARNIKSLSSEKSFASGGKEDGVNKILIISANNLLQEAQNALLKMFEEPNKSTLLFLIVPESKILLKTLFSRFYFIKYPKASLGVVKEATNFIKMTIRERIDFIKENFASKDDEEGVVGARTRASMFLNSLEEALHDKFFDKEKKFRDLSFFEQIFIARVYLRQNGTSPKSLLEGVALAMPEI